PCPSLTTVMAIVEFVFFAVTSTPSIGPSSAEVTCPVNAAGAEARLAVWASPGWVSKTTPAATVRTSRKLRIDTSVVFDVRKCGQVTGRSIVSYFEREFHSSAFGPARPGGFQLREYDRRSRDSS